MLDFGTILSLMIASALCAVGYFYKRHYDEGREAQTREYEEAREHRHAIHDKLEIQNEKINEIRVELARNCELTKEIHRRTCRD